MQILLELFTYWSVRVRCAVRFKPAQRLEDATHVRVVPHAFSGTKDVVPLVAKKVVSEPAGGCDCYVCHVHLTGAHWNPRIHPTGKGESRS